MLQQVKPEMHPESWRKRIQEDSPAEGAYLCDVLTESGYLKEVTVGWGDSILYLITKCRQVGQGGTGRFKRPLCISHSLAWVQALRRITRRKSHLHRRVNWFRKWLMSSGDRRWMDGRKKCFRFCSTKFVLTVDLRGHTTQ